MKLEEQEYTCGACGTNTFQILHRKYSVDDREFIQTMVVQCSHCKSRTHIGISTPKLELNWMEGSEGIITL